MHERVALPMRIILTSLALSLAAPATAAPADTFFAQGQFAQAASAAHGAGDHVMAAKATLVQAAFQATTRDQALTMLAYALDEADAALARTPNNPDAVLQRALIIGYRGKLRKNAGDARDARKQMEAVTAAAPNNALGWAALGGWHGDAIIDVGPMLAGMALGAKKNEATRDFEIAIARDPASPIFPTYYAIVLLRLEKGATAKAQALLRTATALKPRDGFEALMKARAVQLLVPLKAGNPELARALAAQLAPFGAIPAKP